MRKLTFLALFVTGLIQTTIADDQFLPENILQTDAFFNHHIIVAEKSSHKLYLFSNQNGLPKLIETYQVATGKKAGDKFFQGDHRTPEGIYHFTEFLPHQELLKRHGKAGEIYGVGAFVMNYPNPIDRREGKTGGGIWLHSTNDETRIEKGLDSRGCIVAHNGNLINISKYIELNRTNVIVVHNLRYLPRESWLQEREKISSTVSDWVDAWTNEDFNRYISHYSKKEFFDKNRGGYANYRQYKRAVFANPGKPSISLENVSITKSRDYAVVTFKQVYNSSNINDIGKKLLYLKKNEYYQWKIVSEVWTKHGIENPESETVAFQPKMRFFETTDPAMILGENFNQQNQTEKN
ncbi:L,D-transpeptidase family protein [Halobacteriovorax sp. GB3]|uniref:L,D-transpeptidase family protein n=1 Tax=Halobacteriovorax sp. GB3 TaxID=2719615 RepID=UPI00235FB2E2|nr:L,D-transpeptidase family protein [Halobacteriovorax sp. GB3]MDD0853501.1 L,D-transpeptidase family protein [Halobacteriovorax sp. GB3]